MKSKCAWILTTSILMMLTIIACASNKTSQFDINDICRIVDVGSVEIDGEKNKLYPVFFDKLIAIENIKKEVPDLLNILSSDTELPDLDMENWKSYHEMLLNYDYSKCDDKCYVEYQELRSFFDIFENYEKNEKILNSAEKYRGIKSKQMCNNEIDILKTDLAYALPFGNPLPNVLNSKTILKSSIGSWTPHLAMQYAIAHATNRNTPTYYSFTHGDCANFVSQILENGGKIQQVSSSTSSGWWHRKTGLIHSHSLSWSVADNFARYRGISYTTTSNVSFSKNILAGDFVIADYTNDGDWDHCAFITQRDNYINAMLDYFDYKIAQHSRDYNEWASTSRSDWDLIGQNGGKYGRVVP